MIVADFGRDARDRLTAAGNPPTYRETDAGHWLPPEIVGEVREFVGRHPGREQGTLNDERPPGGGRSRSMWRFAQTPMT